MYSIEKYIGEKVRRISFLVKREDDGQYHHLMSVVEYLFPDMQDYDDFRFQNKGEYIDFVKEADGDKDKVFFVVDFPVLTEEFLKKPISNYTIGGDKVLGWTNDDGLCSWKHKMPVIVPLHQDSKGSLAYILPKRKVSAFVNVFQPTQAPKLDYRITDQLKRLSNKHLGRDFTLYPEYIGTCITVCYNPIYHSLDFTEDATDSGIYVRVDYREESKKILSFKFRTYFEDDSFKDIGLVPSIESAFLSHFDLPKTFRRLDIEVYDANNRLIDYYEKVVFLHGIVVDMHVKSKEVHIVDENGETTKVIDKFAGEKFTIGNSKADETELKVAPEISYQHTENSLDFIFFDGDKEHMKENESKAEKSVMRILNTANKCCYICDMYFTVETLKRFVMPIQLENVEIRILSSKEMLKAVDIKQLKQGCKALRDANISNVHCRLLRGEKAALHDRYLVADEKVWFVGCSFDEIGKRATTIGRVPTDYSKKILDRIEEWWGNDELSEEI